MGIDEIITLDDGKEYILLLETRYENEKYFLASLAINKEPSDTYTVFKEIIENGEISVEEITNEELIGKLHEDFDTQIDNMEED